MLNYIWGGLIVLSLVFALTSDINDFVRDTYRNDTPLPVTVTFEDEYTPTARRQPLRLEISDSDLIAHYGDSSMTGSTWEGILLQTSAGREIRFAEGASASGTSGNDLQTKRARATAGVRYRVPPLVPSGDQLLHLPRCDGSK